MSLFGQLTAKQFLRGYWQKKPLLVKQSFPDFVTPLSPEELAGLACEDEIESRIITTVQNAECPWQVRNGPFTESDFSSLGNKDWTLLVQDCQHYDAQVADLLQYFNFVPRWRLDDIMISYATTGGSVGPHIDQYDVFLIQGLGERCWQIDLNATTENNLYPGCELDILREFNADVEWVLSPGDMLYLPPGVAHYGVAMNDCMTLSVGFRAPSHQEMLGACLETLMQNSSAEQRFSDPHRGLPEYSTEIEAQDIEQFTEYLKTQLDDKQLMTEVFGRLVTEPKDVPVFESVIDNKETILKQGIHLNPDARIAFSRERYYHIRLFANGESIEVAPPAAPLVPRLCENGFLAANDYVGIIDSAEFNTLVDFLLDNALLVHDD